MRDMKVILITVVIILSFLCIIGSLAVEEVNNDDIAITGDANTTKEAKTAKAVKEAKTAKAIKPTQEPIINVDAQTLSNAYTENEVTGDAAYKGKKCNVSGKISLISVVLGVPEVSLSVDDGFGSIICKFKDKAELTKLTKGQQISILGVCEGNPGFVVSLKDCSIN